MPKAEDLSDVLTILERLVAFPTVSDSSNTALIRYISDYLSQLGASFHIFPDETCQKQGLIAHIGPNTGGGVILSGHTDVVPVGGQSWSSDPWVLTQRQTNFYGRGTCDMKGFLALVLAAVPEMVASPLVRPIQLGFSFDEEIGCTGTAPLLAALQGQYPVADTVIVGEPTSMKVVTGHKGGIGATTIIRGKAAHSSLPDLGVSAISHAAMLVQWHDAKMQSLKVTCDPDTGFHPCHSTLQVGTIRGGTAMNTVPDQCELETDIRFLPSEQAEDWLAEYRTELTRVERMMLNKCSEASVVLADIEVIPGVSPEPGGAAELLARQLTGDNSNNMVSYQTEGGHFQEAGYSTVICGPGFINQAHQPDEFISADQLLQGQRFLEQLIQKMI